MTSLGLLLFGLAVASGASAQTYSYSDDGKLARVTDATGVSVQYFYDATGNLVSSQSAQNIFLPVITTQPAERAALVGQSVTFSVGLATTVNMFYQWQKDGTDIAGATNSTLVLSNVQTGTAGSYRVLVRSALDTVVSNAAFLQVGPAVLPTISTPPPAQNVTAGAAVRFEVTATGTPTPSYQWLKNGAPLSGATSASLALSNVQSSDAANYTVSVTNSAGSATSAAAALTVSTPTAAPSVSSSPSSFAISLNSTVVLRVAAARAATYQWRKDGVAISGATQPTLVLPGFAASDGGSYTVDVSNTLGQVTTSPATIAVSDSSDFGRIVNLSILTNLTAEVPSFKVGMVLGGYATKGNKPILVRAAGPSLTPFGVTQFLTDPKLDLYSGGSVMASNDNWGGSPVLTASMAQVGAFAYLNSASKDAAIARTLAAGPYVADIGGVGSAVGTVIAELYDSTPAGSQSPVTPRIVNISTLKVIPVGETVTTGFVIGGSTSKTVLIRAIGPSLALFGVGGFMVDPKLTLFSGPTPIAANDNWGGDPQLAATATAVGAFSLIGAGSRDAVLLATLPPGAYTAQATAADGGSGFTLIEVYEVP